jgi:hypothetical protein
VIAGITAALAAGSCSPDVVAIEARKHAGLPAAAGEPGPRPSRAAVITLPSRQQALPADSRPLPSMARYDELLTPPAARKEGA